MLKSYDEVNKVDVSSESEVISTQIENTTTPRNEERIIKIISENSAISQTEIAAKLGVIVVDGVKYHFKELREKGVIKHIGAAESGTII